MNLALSARTYCRTACRLSKFGGGSILLIFGKMVLSRVFYGIGPKEFDWFRFKDKSLRCLGSYMPVAELAQLQQEMVPSEVRYLDEDKIEFWKRCEERGLPTVPIIAIVVNYRVKKTYGVPVARSAADLERLIGTQNIQGFAKPLRGGEGYGTFVFEVFDKEVKFKGTSGSVRDLYEYCVSRRSGRQHYILQPRVVPHEGLKAIMPGPGLGTFRLITFVLPDESVVIPWAVLKVPGPGEVVSNVRFGSLVVSVDLKTGVLGKAIGPTVTRPIWSEVKRHPENGAQFTGVIVPMWQEVKELVIKAAHEFAELPCLGWDVVICPTGPVLLETNWQFGISTEQVVLNKGLKSQIRELYARAKKKVEPREKKSVS